MMINPRKLMGHVYVHGGGSTVPPQVSGASALLPTCCRVRIQLRSSHGFKGLGSASWGSWGWSPSLRGFVGENPIPADCLLCYGLEHLLWLMLKLGCAGRASTELVLPSLQLEAGAATQTAKLLWMHTGE